MNEQLHTDCSILRNNLPAVLPISLNRNLSTKVHGPYFFKQIVQKYSIVTRSGSLPSLILLRLLENAVGTTKLTNVNKNNIKNILNTGIRQYLNLYLTIRSPENAIVSGSYINNALSSGKRVHEQQVNIQTDLAKDTKHVVIPRLVRYLQTIDDQDSGYKFRPVSAKTLATTKLMRTLPERMVFQRKRSKNTTILSNNHYLESDIRVIGHTNSDRDDNLVSADIDKTQASRIPASGIQIDKTGTFSEYRHLKMPDVPLFDEYTNPVIADISGVGVSENRKVRDIIVHPVTHAEEKIPKTDTMMAHIQKRNKLVYEKYDDFSKRTADRYLVTEKNNIANRLISGTHIAGSRMTNAGVEADEVTGFSKGISPQENSQKTSKLLFDQDGAFLQHAGHAQTGMGGQLNYPSNNISGRSSGLVLRKPAVYSAEKGFENREKPDIVKIERTKINAEKEDIIGTNIRARNSIDDIVTNDNIATIADKVYKLLETRISIEKERRGLR